MLFPHAELRMTDNFSLERMSSSPRSYRTWIRCVLVAWLK